MVISGKTRRRHSVKSRYIYRYVRGYPANVGEMFNINSSPKHTKLSVPHDILFLCAPVGIHLLGRVPAFPEAAEDPPDSLLDLPAEVQVEEAVDDGVDGVVDEDAVGEDLDDHHTAHRLVLVKVFVEGSHHHHSDAGEVTQDEGDSHSEQNHSGAGHLRRD